MQLAVMIFFLLFHSERHLTPFSPFQPCPSSPLKILQHTLNKV